MIKYGLISETDSRTLEKTIDLICNEFPDDRINILEIGLYNCETSKGISDYLFSKNRKFYYTGIDNEKDKEIHPYHLVKYIKGNSSEVYNQIPDNSQYLIFFDSDHSFVGVISDFYAYYDKVKIGGYIAFHDTGKHIKPFKDFQHGDKDNPKAYISVREALLQVGLLGYCGKYKTDLKAVATALYGEMDIEEYLETMKAMGFYYIDGYLCRKQLLGWQLIFDEADETNEAGGICVFKKLP